eukprot:Tbor_TRINITY_DN5274_c0_g1::TRINITY_DN5274_c0_g1_i1::g.16051::m.16051
MFRLHTLSTTAASACVHMDTRRPTPTQVQRLSRTASGLVSSIVIRAPQSHYEDVMHQSRAIHFTPIYRDLKHVSTSINTSSDTGALTNSKDHKAADKETKSQHIDKAEDMFKLIIDEMKDIPLSNHEKELVYQLACDVFHEKEDSSVKFDSAVLSQEEILQSVMDHYKMNVTINEYKKGVVMSYKALGVLMCTMVKLMGNGGKEGSKYREKASALVRAQESLRSISADNTTPWVANTSLFSYVTRSLFKGHCLPLSTKCSNKEYKNNTVKDSESRDEGNVEDYMVDASSPYFPVTKNFLNLLHKSYNIPTSAAITIPPIADQTSKKTPTNKILPQNEFAHFFVNNSISKDDHEDGKGQEDSEALKALENFYKERSFKNPFEIAHKYDHITSVSVKKVKVNGVLIKGDFSSNFVSMLKSMEESGNEWVKVDNNDKSEKNCERTKGSIEPIFQRFERNIIEGVNTDTNDTVSAKGKDKSMVRLRKKMRNKNSISSFLKFIDGSLCTKKKSDSVALTNTTKSARPLVISVDLLLSVVVPPRRYIPDYDFFEERVVSTDGKAVTKRRMSKFLALIASTGVLRFFDVIHKMFTGKTFQIICDSDMSASLINGVLRKTGVSKMRNTESKDGAETPASHNTAKRGRLIPDDVRYFAGNTIINEKEFSHVSVDTTDAPADNVSEILNIFNEEGGYLTELKAMRLVFNSIDNEWVIDGIAHTRSFEEMD